MRMFKRACCLLLAVPSAALAQPGWHDYGNARFAYHICYPANFRPLGESDNGDGQHFRSAGDGASMAVWGAYNVNNDSVARLLDQTLSDLRGRSGTISYRTARPDWAAASGVNGGQIFYVKVMLRGDRVLGFELTYPRRAQARYQPIVTRIERCFAALPASN